jgi:hypothetical protein
MQRTNARRSWRTVFDSATRHGGTAGLAVGLAAVMCLAALAGIGLAVASGTSHASATALPALPRTALGTSVPLGFNSETGPSIGGLPDLLALVPLTQSATIVVTLPIQNASSLQSFLKSVSDPNSETYAQFLTPSQFAADYAPPATEQQAIANYLSNNGATIVYETPDHLSITATATLSQLQTIFGVTFAMYTKAGQVYYAPTSSPSFPSSLAPWVYGVAGLTDYTFGYHPDILPMSEHVSASDVAGMGSEDLPNQMLYEYQLNPLFNATGNRTAGVVPTTARGVTISPLLWSSAIPNDCGYSLADVVGFYNGTTGGGPSFPSDLAQPTDHAYWNVAGDPGGPPGPAGCDTFGTSPNTLSEELSLELTIDQEYSGEDAPGATIAPTYVNGTTATVLNSDLEILLAWVAAGNVPNLSVVSQSFGGGESNDSAGSYEAVSEQDYQEMAAEGVTVLASSGDDDGAGGVNGTGEAVCGSGPTGYGEPIVDYPGSSPNVLSVGGTANMALATPADPSAILPGQTVWNWCPGNAEVGGSTGGVSSAFPEAWYQSSDPVVDRAMLNAINVTESGNGSANSPAGINDGVVYSSNSARAVPDIAGPAANMTAYFGQQWISGWGGTSFSSPSVAGMVGSIVAFDGHRLGLFGPALYTLEQEWLDHQIPLAPTYYVQNYSNAFYSGATDYNTSSGWGVPQAYNIALLLGKPFLSTNPTGAAEVGSPYAISANVVDDRNVSKVQVAYVAPGGDGWANTSLTLSAGTAKNGTWTGAIPAPTSTGALVYCVDAIDQGQGNSWTPYNLSGWAATGGSNPAFGCTHPWTIPVHATYDAVFSERGLAEGTTWSVEVAGASHSSSDSSISVLLPNGTYPYTVGSVAGYHAPSPASGTVTLDGSSVTVLVTFSRPNYDLTFTETGLPKGTIWAVTLNGGTFVSTNGKEVTFEEPNGTYSYTISSVPGWEISSGSYSGTVTLDGGGASVSVKWNQVTYKATFSESGLKKGSSWTVEADSIIASSSSKSITLKLPNGTYSWTASANGYTTVIGQVTIDGASATVAVSFQASSGAPAQSAAAQPLVARPTDGGPANSR